jgi:hypothetical protein
MIIFDRVMSKNVILKTKKIFSVKIGVLRAKLYLKNNNFTKIKDIYDIFPLEA